MADLRSLPASPASASSLVNDDAAVLADLREGWGIAQDYPLHLVGRLRLAGGDGGTFGFLADLEHPEHGGKLISLTTGRPADAFIPPDEMAEVRPLLRSTKADIWALAELQRSPPSVRQSRHDPYALTVMPGSLKLLTNLPKGWNVPLTGPVDAPRILQLAHDAIIERLDREEATLRRALDSRIDAQDRQLQVQVGRLEEARLAVAAEQDRISQLTEAGASLQQDILSMQQRLQSMSELARHQGNRLKALGLLEEAELAHFVPDGKRPAPPPGRPFSDALDADFARLAPYVQARLWKGGIRYSQAQLRDFLALLCTHDLIVLAGDSGSGKTSLVRHVAEAIGARHTIIPVKPNWTGPEDLLGYYNPIERAYQPTAFLEALQAAAADPDVLHLICLDEMNLARVEYYFADFLSLLEDRSGSPEITLYASEEERHAVMEAGLFTAVEAEVRKQTGLPDSVTIEDMLRDETANALLHRLAGLTDAQSLLEYHGRLRRSLTAATRHPTRFAYPPNVRIIGAVNMDETTHPLSPKVLDRAHVMRFRNPALLDWTAIAAQVAQAPDADEPILLTPADLSARSDYPAFDPAHPETEWLLHFAREFLDRIGVEFGLRSIRQAHGYLQHAQAAGLPADAAFNNVVLHKILPKIAFDASRRATGGATRLDILRDFVRVLRETNGSPDPADVSEDAAAVLDSMIQTAEDNNGLISFWSR